MKKEDSLGITSAVADAKTLTICLKPENGDEAAKESCYALDLASGAWSTAKGPATAPKPPAAEFEIKQDDKAVAVCKGVQCTKLAVKAPPKDEDGKLREYLAAVRDDGKCAVVASTELGGAWFFDAKGKKVKALKLVDPKGDNGCMDAVDFAGPYAYVATNVCAGPGAEGAFYDCSGKKVAGLDTGGEPGVNPFGYSPEKLNDSTYVLGDLNGSAVAAFDTKTAKVRIIQIPAPTDCEDCSVLGGTPESSAGLLVTPDGKLVNIDATRVTILDGQGAVQKSYRFPICGAKS